MTKKRALGKGLSALLDSTDTDYNSTNIGVDNKTVGSISSIEISQIEANPFNPRTQFEEEGLQELKSSIEAHGIIQPLTVRKLGRDRYQLISGERRFRASQLVGLTEVPCYIRIANDQSMLEMALVENIQRVDLNAIEVGLSYQRLIDECAFTQEELSKKLGKSRSNIANFLRLLKLPVPIQIGIREGLISMGHARAIVSAGDEDYQLEIFKQIIEKELSVRDVEALIKKGKSSSDKNESNSAEVAELSDTAIELQSFLTDNLNSKVQVSTNNKGAGKIVINFKSEKELKEINDFINQK